MKALLTTLLYGAAGLVVGLGAYLLQRFVAATAKAPAPEASTPYECGEHPIGSAWQGWAWPFLPLAAVLLLLEAEVLFALPWVWVQGSLSWEMALIELFILVVPVGGMYAYLLRKGYFFSGFRRRTEVPAVSERYRELQAYLAGRFGHSGGRGGTKSGLAVSPDSPSGS